MLVTSVLQRRGVEASQCRILSAPDETCRDLLLQARHIKHERRASASAARHEQQRQTAAELDILAADLVRLDAAADLDSVAQALALSARVTDRVVQARRPASRQRAATASIRAFTAGRALDAPGLTVQPGGHRSHTRKWHIADARQDALCSTVQELQMTRLAARVRGHASVEARARHRLASSDGLARRLARLFERVWRIATRPHGTAGAVSRAACTSRARAVVLVIAKDDLGAARAAQNDGYYPVLHPATFHRRSCRRR